VPARPVRRDELGAHLYHVVNEQRPAEADHTDVNWETVLASPADGASVSGLVDPLHHHAAVPFTLEVNVRKVSHKE
jgi:hypothetical protein